MTLLKCETGDILALHVLILHYYLLTIKKSYKANVMSLFLHVHTSNFLVYFSVFMFSSVS